ncbi:meiotic expression up-regulated protein 26 [Fusarium bulbicola]|nr:meiotic expression up-regulated protein 26 [Fusarium bulbicola]
MSDDSISSFYASTLNSTKSLPSYPSSTECGNRPMYGDQSLVVHAILPLVDDGNPQALQQASRVVTSTLSYHENDKMLSAQLPSHMAQMKPLQTAAKQSIQPPPPPPPPPIPPLILRSSRRISRLKLKSTDLSDPPDLYAALREEQIPPPPEDMNPEDPDLIPRQQELQCENDLYTPRWVRCHGNKREGWCGICKPGRWLRLKDSAFWYNKQFSHGISAATGSSFQEPQRKRCSEGRSEVLCGKCQQWIALSSCKTEGTPWFRHAYKVNLTNSMEVSD